MNLELYQLIKNLSTWEGALADITPLLDFLNMEKKDISDYENDALSFTDNLSIKAILKLHSELSSVLYDMLSSGAAKRQSICIFLADQLKTARNEVVFRGSGSRQIQVNIVCDDMVSSIWGDIICIFLSQGYWDYVLGCCYHCNKWFRKARGDQIYCDGNCRNKASYQRHKSKRQEERRFRYRETVTDGEVPTPEE